MHRRHKDSRAGEREHWPNRRKGLPDLPLQPGRAAPGCAHWKLLHVLDPHEELSVQIHTSQWHGFTFHHRNESEFELLSREIFEEGEYWFASDKAHPTILDCGSHIGLSVAWFKRRFPKAQIIAFEPDPDSFRLLQTNVAVNGFQNVELLNVAVYPGGTQLACMESSELRLLWPLPTRCGRNGAARGPNNGSS